MEQSKPDITFYVESREESSRAAYGRGEFLLDKIGTDEVVAVLQKMRGRVAVALRHSELTSDSALIEFLREYNIRGIDIDLWLTLEDKDGYWLHRGNVDCAFRAALETMNEMDRQNVQFQRVGLDLELPLEIVKDGFSAKQLLRSQPWRYPEEAARDRIRELATVIFMEGHCVDFYELPILSDNTFSRRVLGIPSPPSPPLNPSAAGRVGLVYSSYKPRVVPPRKFIQDYSTGKGRVPGLGIISGTDSNPGRNLGGEPHLLTQEEFERDVGFAMETNPERMFVFALNSPEVIKRTQQAVSRVLSKT